MNGLKKAYCRTFQTVFRIAIPFLPYRNPKILNKVKDVSAMIAARGLKKPLLVTDEAIRGLGLTKELETYLTESGHPAAVYDKTKPNPTADMVAEALKIYKENHCDCLIAFGGGSPMDCAKAVGACIASPGKSLGDMAGILKVWRKTPVIFAVPTTAGTGSETTLAAVIVDNKERHKYVINSFPLIPSYAVLDPAVIRSLPAAIAATTGMDALTHAVEAYIGGSTTKETRKDARKAVHLIFENIRAATAHESVKAEKAMLVAAHLAGRAFTRSYVGYIHAVSHSLSGRYNTPHGLGNAVLLPIVLEMYGPVIYPKLAQLAVCAGIGKVTEPEEERAKRFIQAIYDMNEELGIPKKLEGIREEDLDILAAHADREANPLYPVPVLWDKDQLKPIYRKVM